MKLHLRHIVLIPVLWAAAAAADAAPQVIDYRLHLGPDAGPVQGPIALVFTAYADSIGGSPLWRESHSPVADTDGNVRLSLGSVTPLPPAILARSIFWLEIMLRDRVLPTRRRIGVVALPFRDTAADSSRWNPVPPERLPDGRVRMVLVDFGPLGQEAPHRVALGAEDRSPSFGWVGGPIRERTRPVASGFYYCDFVEGHDASFVMAVEPPKASYRVTLVLGDTESARGPVDVLAGGQTGGVTPATKAGELTSVTFEVKPESGRITIRLRERGCDPWAVVGLDLYGPPGARLTNLFSVKKPDTPVPPPDKLSNLDRVDPRQILRSYCQFLMAERLSDGSFSSTGAWYANAYPIRSLLAGSILLDEPAWRAAAFECLDRFVEAQRPDGNWYSAYFGPPGCSSVGPPGTMSANLADLGSMSLCLAIAAPHADKPRQARYLGAATRYADRVVLPAQLASGAFPNGLYQGTVYRHPYSVATATQAASLAALGALTGNPRYTDAAERAAFWLAERVRPDGSVVLAPHDTDKVRVLPSTSFGDVFYIVEALTWVERHAVRRDARSASRLALEHYLWGARGLKASAEQGYWWKPQNLWSDSKMGGMLYVLTEVERWSHPGALGDWIPQSLAWLADPGLSRQIGVMSPLPSKTGVHGMTATGFAGIGVANLIDPRVLALTGPVADVLGPSARSAPRSD